MKTMICVKAANLLFQYIHFILDYLNQIFVW